MSSQPSPSSSRPIHWVLDWDGTITQHDTLSALVNIAALQKPLHPIHDKWTAVCKAYADDYSTSLAELTTSGELPRTVNREHDLLLAMKQVELRSLERVCEAGIFADLADQDIADGAREAILSADVEIRKGFSSFLDAVQTRSRFGGRKRPDCVTILSVNWSRQFIASCLSTLSSHHAIPLFSILANDIQHPSGQISDSIVCSADKLRHLQDLRAAEPDSQLVYVGDSWTDIECLLDADLGICVRNDVMGSSQRALADAFVRLSVDCERLGKGVGEEVVAWVKGWDEVIHWMTRETEMEAAMSKLVQYD